MNKIIIGDIFEINTPKRKGYLHYVYKDKKIGHLIRVLPGLYSKRPSDLIELAASKERYMIFFPLLAAVNRRIVEYAGHFDPKYFIRPEYKMDNLDNMKTLAFDLGRSETNVWTPAAIAL